MDPSYRAIGEGGVIYLALRLYGKSPAISINALQRIKFKKKNWVSDAAEQNLGALKLPATATANATSRMRDLYYKEGVNNNNRGCLGIPP